jgi:hypothetical protein
MEVHLFILLRPNAHANGLRYAVPFTVMFDFLILEPQTTSRRIGRPSRISIKRQRPD